MTRCRNCAVLLQELEAKRSIDKLAAFFTHLSFGQAAIAAYQKGPLCKACLEKELGEEKENCGGKGSNWLKD